MRDEIARGFLKEVKKKVAKGDFTVADRGKNVSFLKNNGLNNDHVREAILQLSDKDNPLGPEKDRGGHPGYVYKFKTNYLTDELIYIKIRYNPPDEVVCISFHQDEV